MLTIRKMTAEDYRELYPLALRAFQPDYEQHGHYPPLMNTEKQAFRVKRVFGLTLLLDDRRVGGAFVLALFGQGELGAIFLDPDCQGQGLGKEAMLLIEQTYPRVKRWKLETPNTNTHLHRFYEGLGYVKVGETKPLDESGFRGFKYQKTTV